MVDRDSHSFLPLHRLLAKGLRMNSLYESGPPFQTRLLYTLKEVATMTKKAWKAPAVRDVQLGMEINSYACAEVARR